MYSGLAVPALVITLLMPLFLQIPMTLVSIFCFYIARRVNFLTQEIPFTALVIKTYLFASFAQLAIWIPWHLWAFSNSKSFTPPPFLIATPYPYLVLGATLAIALLVKNCMPHTKSPLKSIVVFLVVCTALSVTGWVVGHA